MTVDVLYGRDFVVQKASALASADGDVDELLQSSLALMERILAGKDITVYF